MTSRIFSQVIQPTFRAIALVALGLSVLAITGCGGCGNKNTKTAAEKKKEEEEKKKKKEKVKPPFENRQPFIVPGHEKNPVQANRGKGGHWFSVFSPVVSNRSDFDGSMEATPVRVSDRPIVMPGTDFYPSSIRPVSLPKEQWKNLETTVYMPFRGDRPGGGGNTTIDFRIRPRSGAGGISFAQGVVLLREYQNHFVVLSSNPDVYTYLKNADFIKLPNDGTFVRLENFYHLVYNYKDSPVPLPNHPLAWTTIAYILWNDLDPDTLNPEQQTALVDWLHWGGQIILSGPDCLDRLKSSFLAEYLPANVKENVNLKMSDLSTFDDTWSIPVRKNASQKHRLSLPGGSTIAGCRFELKEGGNFVDRTQELVVEKRVGRGRVVATAFSLHAKPLLSWKSYSGFYQTVLMRRPARRFNNTDRHGIVSMRWEDGGALLDPLLGSTVRYVSRDLGIDGTERLYNFLGTDPEEEYYSPRRNQFGFGNSQPAVVSTASKENTRHLEDHWHYGGYNHSPESGVAGWNDTNGVAEVARETLGYAAGITPPSRNFVFKMLMIYLSVLVPANWIIFRVIGRVEWAWVMAPIISVVGAVGVAKFASLDIGFVRSSTSVGVLEMHADYPRGHLTNYTSLYTSLSTDYNVEYPDSSALVLPFAKPDYTKPIDATANAIQLKTGRYTEFNGFPIQSNTSKRFHSENIIDVGGTISYFKDENGKLVFSNSTKLEIRDAAIVRCRPDGKIQIAWLGDIESGQEIDSLQFVDAEPGSLSGFWESPVMYNPVRHARELLSEMQFPSDEIPMETFLNTIRNDADTSDRFSKYEQAARQSPSLTAEQKRNFPDVLIHFDQMVAICEQANDQERFRLGQLLDLFLHSLKLEKGEARLLGWTSQEVDQSEIKPLATQATQRTMILVHLQRPALPAPKTEKTIYADYSELIFDDEDDEGKENSGPKDNGAADGSPAEDKNNSKSDPTGKEVR